MRQTTLPSQKMTAKNRYPVIRRAIAPLLFAAAVALSTLTARNPWLSAQTSTTLSVNGSQQFQVIDGFGVNANSASWNGGELRPALDLLVDQVGATLWRVVIDNGDWEATNDNADPNVFDWTYYNSVYTTPKFEELWSTIAYLNQKGISSGLMLSFMGPVAPWMGGEQITVAAEDEWVEMVASIMYYGRVTRGLQIPLLSPMNETDWNGVEGPQVTATQYARLMRKLSLKLDGLGLSNVGLVGAETAAPEAGVDTYMPAMMAEPALMSKVQHFALHSYTGNTAGADSAIKNSAYPTRNFWLTEFCNMVDLLAPIAQGASAALVWDGYDSTYNHAIYGGNGSTPPNDAGNGPALLAYSTTTRTYTPRKVFYEMAQLFKFVAPGSRRIGATDSSASLTVYAFHDESRGRLTIFGRSTSSGAMTVNGTLAAVPSVSSLEFYQTTASMNMQRGGDVVVSNGAFSVQVAGNSTFTLTTTTTPDTEAPTIAVSEPIGGAMVAGTVPVRASASDNIGVAGVQFLLDGNVLGGEDTAAPFEVQWNTTMAAAGLHDLSARARDGAGNQHTSTVVTVTVDNTDTTPPTVTGTTPGNGALGVPLGATVTASFSEPMDATTISGTTLTLRTGGNPVSATISYSNAIATLTPSAPLAPGTTYTMTVNGGVAGVMDVAGNALVNDVTWSFTTAADDTTPPAVTGATPASGATGVSTTAVATVTFNETVDAATITAGTFELRTPANALVPAAVSYNGATRTATLTPSAPLANGTAYTATVRGGTSDPRVKDVAGNALAANFIWSFTTAAATGNCPCTIWSPTVIPARIETSDTNAVELGVKFRADVAGSITALRYYKGSTATGTHVGHLWTSTGTLLSTATFTGETASGWQQVALPSPISIAANTTYVASYYAPAGRYAVNDGYFGAAFDRAPLHALANGASGGNGVYRYGGGGGFPTQSFNSSNYWVDVVFQPAVTDSTAPAVVAISPASGATGIGTTASVTVQFSEAMNAATIASTTFELRNPANALIAAAISYNSATTTATLVPSAALESGTTYTAMVRGGTTDPRVKDVAGNALAANVSWSFTTAADTTPPTVTGATPANGATGVSTTATATVTFNEAMQAATIAASTFELRTAENALVPSAVSYNAATRTATLTPSAPLANATAYTAAVRGGTTDPRVKDVAGNALAANFSWSFTTVAETTPPTVTSTTPANGATGVGITSAATVTFNEAMDAATITASTFELRTAGNVLVPSTVGYNSATRMATLTPSAPLANGTAYTATVRGGTIDPRVKDVAGNALAANSSWSFTTVAETTPPTVTGATPANGATGVSITSSVTVTFDEAMNAATITASTFELRTLANVLVPAAISYNSATRTAALTPSAPLANGSAYSATVRGGTTDPRVKDIAGNALAADFIWSFTTAADTTPPTVTGATPSNGATGVNTTTSATITFNEAMDAATITVSTFELRTPAYVLVPAAVSYNSATRTATLTPSAALANGTAYTATVRGGTADPRAKDVAGNALAANFVWSFTTVAGATGNCPCSIWSATASPARIETGDKASVELGVRFRADVNGSITGLRFYKGSTTTGTHTGKLWSNTGTLLGSLTFTNETASGWQQASFATPIAITANTTYIASYHSNVGNYAVTDGYFTTAVAKPPLRALANGTGSANGLYRYGASAFPNLTYNASNYWIDVVFVPAAPQ
jgi:hypothetical protein